MNNFYENMHQMCLQVQQSICDRIQTLEPARTFQVDRWQHAEQGGGRTMVLQQGAVFDKAGVGVSAVGGSLSPAAMQAMLEKSDNQHLSAKFRAVGISLVLHPHNPFLPTVHANYRYFEQGDHFERHWFGGGADLTPNYLYEEDAEHFHRVLKVCCDASDQNFYRQFKANCDRYFYLPHRGETRGVGGIFFDELCMPQPGDTLAFVERCAKNFLASYWPIVLRRMHQPFMPAHQTWQALRRGRYVEFNLLYDRGTLFGLRSGGRIESIFMSLPLHAAWQYDVHAASFGREEARLQAVLQQPRDWVVA